MNKTDSRAKVGFILGLISIIAWIIPIVGLPITVLAIIYSSLGLKSVTRHGKAVAGLVLGIVFVVATLLNGIAGAAIGVMHATQMQSTNTITNTNPSEQ